jgi:DNA-binding Xre family transcriptional regulator
MGRITTTGRITIMLGKRQAATGERLSPRRLADIARVPKDLVYRLDAGEARYVDLRALERLCAALRCRADEILVWENEGANEGAIGDETPAAETPGGEDNGRAQ